MRLLRALFCCLGLIMLTACSASYKDLSNNSHIPPTKFTKFLMDSYTTKADFEAKKMHDWDSTKLYSEKALRAVSGQKIKPERINYWKIPTKHIAELQQAYDNLMKVYALAIESDPYNLAVAISSLDCWAEQQEENWQTWDINDCKNDYLFAIHNIYNVVSENKINKQDKDKQDNEIIDTVNTSVTVVTKDKNNTIKQIIYFDFDKSTLSGVNLQEIKNFLITHQKVINEYLVIGHTDAKGTKEYNLKLSLERAIAVKNLFIEYGVNKSNIKILGKGETELAIDTKDGIAHPANRRVEITPIN